MKSTSNNNVSVWGTTKWVFGVLGMLVGAASVSSLIRHGIDIRITGVPKILIDQYVDLRDAIFLPLSWISKNILAVTLPAWIKDTLAGYAVASGGIWRASMILRERDIEWHERDKENMHQALRESARVNNINPDDLIKRVERGIGDQKYYAIRAIRSAVLWPRVLFRNAKQSVAADKLSANNGRAILCTFSIQVALVLLMSASFFVWNYLSAQVN